MNAEQLFSPVFRLRSPVSHPLFPDLPSPVQTFERSDDSLLQSSISPHFQPSNLKIFSRQHLFLKGQHLLLKQLTRSMR
jgi:hypothetical protein